MIKNTLFIISLILIIFLVGYKTNIYHPQNPLEYIVSTIEGFNHHPKTSFIKGWRIIKNNYVDKTMNHQKWGKWKKRYKNEIETREDARIALESMLASLNDPYTRFLPREDFEEQNRNIDSRLQGIGVHITEINGETIIISVIEDTPAEKYGLKKKDKILKVDGVITKGLSLSDVAKMVRGKRGTAVELKILRNKKTFTKTIIREQIKIKTVKKEMLDNNIAYIRISSFISSDTANEFRKALKETQNSDGIIVDVRGNYGGLLSNAVYISDMFLDKGIIVSIVDRNGKKEDYKANYNDFMIKKPVVILIDESSASASEIFSGARKDHKKALLVGEKTFGKGRVQMITRLPNGSGINFTVAKYLTPTGIDIDHKGIEPDFKVEDDTNGLFKKEDIQRKKAVELLLEKIKQKNAA